MNNKFFYGDTDSIHCKENNNVIEELAFMDEKLDKILEQQDLIMKKLSIMNPADYISSEGFDFIGDTMEDWFKDVLNKLHGISGIVEREGE